MVTCSTAVGLDWPINSSVECSIDTPSGARNCCPFGRRVLNFSCEIMWKLSILFNKMFN